jgi:hypothetical protein
VNPTDCVFAPRPLANFVWSDPAVPIWPYSQGTLLQFDGPGVQMGFAAVDLDVWGQALAEAVDWVTSLGYGAELRSVKETLAARFTELLMPAFADEVPDPEALAAARDAYRKTLLTALANAYADRGAGAPLRRAPAPPVLVSQAAVVDGLLEWRYSVEYAQFDRAVQDEVRFTLAGAPVIGAGAASNPLFLALAEFAVVYPEMRADVEGGDREALGSVVNVLARVTAAWSIVPAVRNASDDGMATVTEFEQDGRLVLRVETMTPSIAGYTTTGTTSDYQFVAPDGGYLAAVEGRALPRRQLLSAPGQIVESRTGTFAACVVRNARFAPEFVYHSELVTFAAPFHARIEHEQPVSLTEFATPPNTVAGYLRSLFERVFGGDPVAIETSLSGAYESDQGALPIFLTTAMDPAAIAEAVVNWMRENEPVREGAMLRFDLAVRSTASGAPVPLLRLRNLFVSIEDVAGL